MRYLLTLPLRMAKAAVVVPLQDLDQKLGLSAAQRHIEDWADSIQLIA